MLEDSIIVPDLEKAVESLEDGSLNSDWSRSRWFRLIQHALDSGSQVQVSVIEKLLVICEHDMKEKMQNTANSLSILSSILKRVKAGDYSSELNLVPSALGVIKVIKTTALLLKVDSLKALCFETLLSYPDETLVTIAMVHCVEVMEILSLYGHQQIPLENRIQTFNIIYKLLKVLPIEKRGGFVKAGMPHWFSKIIPSAIIHLSMPNQDNLVPLLALELLAEELIYIDYADDLQWQNILENICKPRRYPAIMKSLLEKDSDIWHRLWILFIKLLKNQITRSNNTNGSPINSMLSIVETAFKMDVVNRCRAFHCWNALIDNFCTETNESYINKRLKLLVVPLLSNNAKVEETALAKFNCWWHLIVKFQHKLDKFVNVILIPFIRFCYGKAADNERCLFVPGKFSNAIKEQCRQALVEIFGHANCNGCTNIPKLQGKILNTQYLVQYLAEWLHAFQSAVMLASNHEIEITGQQIMCLWKSLIIIISDMPENTVRKDVTNEALSTVSHMVLNAETTDKVRNIVFNILIHSFDDDKAKQIFKIKDQEGSPINHLINILMNPSMFLYYQRYTTMELTAMFKPVACFIVDEAVKSQKHVTKSLLKELTPNRYSLALWTSLAETMYESDRDICSYNVCDTVLWPLQFMDRFPEDHNSAEIWYKLYNSVYKNINKTTIENEVTNIIMCEKDTNDSNRIWKLNATLAILKKGIANYEADGYENMAELLLKLITNINAFDMEVILAVLVDTVVIMMDSSATAVCVNDKFVQTTISCLRTLLNFLAQKYAKDSEESHLIMIKNLLKSVEFLYKVKSSKVKSVIAAELVELSFQFGKHALIINTIIPIMQSCLLNTTDDNKITKDLKNAIDSVDVKCDLTKNDEVNSNQNPDESTFFSPNILTKRKVTKLAKKKETSIVNTVVENGEEFVVVKSNWKFNPKKLTENQKEKFQRKRDDIPALYQDLSQSQDEFKLTAWKTDSQDASSTTSQTNTSKPANEESSSILKNMPNTDVVPKIMENLMTDNNKQGLPVKEGDAPKSKLTELVSPRNTKSPRMALKDRVFRNVRNLIEKSSLPYEDKNVSVNLIQNENTPETPISKSKVTDNVINSAPPMISSERPSRVKRKPRKFDDVELFALKRGRRSVSLNDSQPDMEEVTPSAASAVTENSEKERDNCMTIALIHHNEVQDEPGVSMEIGGTISECKAIESSAEALVTPRVDFTDTEIEKPHPMERSVNNLTLNSDSNVVSAEITNISDSENASSKDSRIQSMELENKMSLDTEINNSKTAKIINCKNTDKNLVMNTEPKVTNVCDMVTVIDKPTENVTDGEIQSKVTTPKPIKGKQINASKSTSKKNSVGKKSRIEKELAIDMVEGHPFLKVQSEKRLTRKLLTSLESNVRRKRTKLDFPKSLSNVEKKAKDRGKGNKADSAAATATAIVSDTDVICSIASPDTSLSEKQADSEDVIESSQDSTFTTISVKSMRKKIPRVELVKLPTKTNPPSETQKQLDDIENEIIVLPDVTNNHESKEDIELPRNQTAVEDSTVLELTENMDTEPMTEKGSSDDVIIINDDDCEPAITIDTEDTIGPETQEIAEAETQPNDPETLQADEPTKTDKHSETVISIQSTADNVNDTETNHNDIKSMPNTANDITEIMIEPLEPEISVETRKSSGTSSPCKDDVQRKKDFLNNTFEISPIKTVSPDREKKSPSPETSGEYVVIKLSSPVHSNGEPFETRGSPEFFTDDKVSPDKRDLSPPRSEVSLTNTSPSSSLSLKKNRPQVRSGGRGAQMLDLCVPERLPSKKTDTVEMDEPNKNSKGISNTTPARRNLRILYNTVTDTNESVEDSDESENFLKFKRMLPTVDSSPSGPILKRKLVEIADDATISPISKRKRVSFHDPPVSTTVSVQKYIEPCGIRSPQNSNQKRLERQMRAQTHTNLKSQKRLDTAFKLDTVLTKAIESFIDVDILVNNTEDTQLSSLEQTPAVEVVKTSELNDRDPIYSELIDCNDPIDNIAAELSSPTMKSLLIKELVGKVETVGDLAKMTELEVNRLCIKAPKVQVARKVLSDYASKVNQNNDKTNEVSTIMEPVRNVVSLPETSATDVQIQTNEVITNDVDVQTVAVNSSLNSTQTDYVSTSTMSVQTKESSFLSTTDVIASCLEERKDFVDKLSSQLSIQQISDGFSVRTLTDALVKKMTASDSSEVLNSVLQQSALHSKQNDESVNRELSFLCNYVSEKFDSNDLILFCSQLLRKVHMKP